jgi:alpha-tubulin suppressor-like RCC1 family protein
VTVNWNTVSGADGYRLYKSSSSPVSTSDTAVIGGGNSHTETGLTSGNTLYFAMLSQNKIGTSGLSNEVSATTVPTQPGTLVATPTASGGSIDTQWTSSSGHDGYRLLYRIGSHSLSDILASPTPISLTATDTSKKVQSVGIDELASFVLVAYNSAGDSTYSNVVEEQPVPRTPKTGTPDVSRPGKVTLTWTENKGVNTFKVYRMTGSSGNPETAGGAPIATLSGSTLTYTDSGFPTYGGTTYRYAVVPEGGGGVGVIDRKNAVPLEPVWETIVYDGADSFINVQAAGSSTGEAFVLATTYNAHRLYKYNDVAELQYEVVLTTGNNYPGGRALALTFAPDGNLMALMRVTSAAVPSNLTSTGDFAYILAKINPADGSYIWNKLINPFTDNQWNTTMDGSKGANFENSVMIGMLAEMVVDSTGASYVAWGSTGTSGYVKYDTNGNLVTTYDRVADTTGETLGRFASKPAVVVLPDDSFVWLQYVNKNSTDYLMGSKWASDGSVIFKNRTLDVANLNDPVTGRTAPNRSSHERHTGTAVADAVGNIFLAVNSTQGRVLKFNSEGTFIGGTNESNISSMTDEVTLATNGESIYAVGSDANQNNQGKFTKFNNTLANTDLAITGIGYQMRQDAYVDPTSCFVYVASVTRLGGAWDYYLGNPTTSYSNRFSTTQINSGDRRKFLLYRVNNDMVLNAASSSCPTPSGLLSTTTPVSIAGNGSELGSYVHSGVNGFGDWRMKYSSASTPVEHDVVGVIDMSYGADSQCVATSTGVQCKGYQGGGLGDAANTTNTSSYVTVDNLTDALDVSVGSDFVCALDSSGAPYCWGNGEKYRLGNKSNTDQPTPVSVTGTTSVFVAIESGAKHSCALTSAGVMECWGSNEEYQMGEDNATKLSFREPSTVAEVSGDKISKVSIGTESLYTAVLTDNGTIKLWGEFNGVGYEDHITIGSSGATDVAAGTNHICYIENDNVTCDSRGDDSAGQSTVPTLSKTPTSVHAGADWSCAGFTDGTYQCWGSKASW